MLDDPAPRRSGGGLFESIFTTDALAAATSDDAWLAAMLEFEAALALAEADEGVVPAEDAEAIAAACARCRIDPGELGREARLSGNPVGPLVRALTADAGPAGRYVHYGATSQDVLDTAAMLIAKRAGALVLGELEGAARACATLVEQHRESLLTARTLLQPALPTTFALKAAGWLDALTDARLELGRVCSLRLAVELGGAAGTLAALGGRGLAVTGNLAARLGLSEPVLPWHTARVRVAQLASALALTAGVAGKIALDVTLLMQFEVAEAFEPPGARRGGSSTLPHKRNPVAGASVAAAVRRAGALAGVILQGLPQEHERAVGAWQAEWQTLGELLRLAGGAVARTSETLQGLEVDAARMRENLDATRGVLLAERVMLRLASSTGRSEAHEIVERASRVALASGQGFAEVLAGDPAVTDHLAPEELDTLLDPADYLGSADEYVDRALATHRRAETETDGTVAP